jgi:hypothetical protein
VSEPSDRRNRLDDALEVGVLEAVAEDKRRRPAGSGLGLVQRLDRAKDDVRRAELLDAERASWLAPSPTASIEITDATPKDKDEAWACFDRAARWMKVNGMQR